MSDRLYLLLGEAPNDATADRPELWLRPDRSGINHSANRLLRFSGMQLTQFLRTFERDNILHHAPDREGKGYGFPLDQARPEVPARLRRFIDEELLGVLVLGRRAANCMSWWEHDEDCNPTAKVPASRVRPFEWHYVSSWTRRQSCPMMSPTAPAVMVPHPSGINQWWNDEANRAAALEFFQSL